MTKKIILVSLLLLLFLCGCSNDEDAKYSKGLDISYDKITNTYTVVGIGFCFDSDVVIPKNVEYISALVFLNCQNLTIYCEATEKLAEWYSDWSAGSSKVIWGY